MDVATFGLFHFTASYDIRPSCE